MRADKLLPSVPFVQDHIVIDTTDDYDDWAAPLPLDVAAVYLGEDHATFVEITWRYTML